MASGKISYTERTDILRFFLNLYRIQNGIGEKAPAEFLSSGEDRFDPGLSYKLRVKKFDKWKSRSLTIDSLGDNSGSKSRCFKVIYDDILVLKIPPVPIKSFFQYVEGIKSERKIADRLKPEIECIHPGISCILRKIPPFSREKDFMSEDELEEHCIRELTKNPELQRYLKIGDGFAFFMDMSRYRFMSNVIENLHDTHQNVEKEILQQEKLLWDLVIFEEKYGDEATDIFFDMNDLYSVYETKIKKLQALYGDTTSIPAYKTKEWFLLHLAGKRVEANESNPYPPGFIDDTHILYEKILSEKKGAVKKYKQFIRQYVHRKTFHRNKKQMGGLITNILDLIARLEKKGVAIRDLKPDNVFVVGDVETDSNILSTPSAYTIGLIDFETAVGFDARYDNKIEQPLLAGTPSYATPSHLFENEILTDIYGDLPRIFHFQDWQAAVGMIYNVVTGERLVEKTGRVLPQTMRVMRKSIEKNRSMKEVFEKSSRIFWYQVKKEFKEKLDAHRKIMDSVEAAIPENAKPVIIEKILYLREKKMKIRQKNIAGQKFFSGGKTREHLMKASSRTISQYRQKYEGDASLEISPEIRTRIVGFLRRLERDAKESETLEKMAGSIEREFSTLRVTDLLQLMFRIIYSEMLRPEWAKEGEYGFDTDEQAIFEEDEGVLQDATIAYDGTIMLNQ